MTYEVIEINFCTDPTLKMAHSIGEATAKALELVNAVEGKIEDIMPDSHDLPTQSSSTEALQLSTLAT